MATTVSVTETCNTKDKKTAPKLGSATTVKCSGIYPV